MKVMKAVTVWQPWATLLALREKVHETRGRRTHYRGPIAIHAAKYIDREACEEPGIKATLARHGYTVDSLPTGAVVAVADLVDCWAVHTHHTSKLPLLLNSRSEAKILTLQEATFGDYTPGRSAWEMGDVLQLTEPIPVKGQQGLWNWERGDEV